MWAKGARQQKQCFFCCFCCCRLCCAVAIHRVIQLSPPVTPDHILCRLTTCCGMKPPRGQGEVWWLGGEVSLCCRWCRVCVSLRVFDGVNIYNGGAVATQYKISVPTKLMLNKNKKTTEKRTHSSTRPFSRSKLSQKPPLQYPLLRCCDHEGGAPSFSTS